MNTCDTCKWWTGRHGIDRGRDHRNCEHPKLDTVAKFAPDGANAPWGVSTGPKFGCVHHESAGIPADMFGPSIEARNALQRSGKVHPYTCGNDTCRQAHPDAVLRAVDAGWVCDWCGYEQRT